MVFFISVMLKPFCHSTIPVLLATIATVILYSIALITVDNSDLSNLCWVAVGCGAFYMSLEMLKNRMVCQKNMMLVGFSGILISTLIARIAVFWSVNYKLVSFRIKLFFKFKLFFTDRFLHLLCINHLLLHHIHFSIPQNHATLEAVQPENIRKNSDRKHFAVCDFLPANT